MGWIKSSKCESSACVEVAVEGGRTVDSVSVRNSKVPGEVVWFTPDEWMAFIVGVKAGEFDL